GGIARVHITNGSGARRKPNGRSLRLRYIRRALPVTRREASRPIFLPLECVTVFHPQNKVGHCPAERLLCHFRFEDQARGGPPRVGTQGGNEVRPERPSDAANNHEKAKRKKPIASPTHGGSEHT